MVIPMEPHTETPIHPHAATDANMNTRSHTHTHTHTRAHTHTHIHIETGLNLERKHNQDFCSVIPALVLRMRDKILRSGAEYHP